MASQLQRCKKMISETDDPVSDFDLLKDYGREWLWEMRHGRVARANLDASRDDYPDHASRLYRAYWKRCELMHLILWHGYTSIGVLAEAWVLSLSRTRSEVRRLAQRGVIQDVRLPASRRRIIMLTRMGAAEAQATLGIQRNYTTDPARISRTRIDHELMVQMAAIDHDDHGARCWLHGYDTYLVDTELRSGEFGLTARPDIALAADPDANEFTMIEVELSRKNPRRLAEKMRGLASLIVDERMRPSACTWYCPSGQVADALARARDQLDGRLGEVRDAIKIVTPDWIYRQL